MQNVQTLHIEGTDVVTLCFVLVFFFERNKKLEYITRQNNELQIASLLMETPAAAIRSRQREEERRATAKVVADTIVSYLASLGI